MVPREQDGPRTGSPGPLDEQGPGKAERLDAPPGARGSGQFRCGKGTPGSHPGTGASSAAGEAARGGGALLPGASPGPGSSVLTQSLQAGDGHTEDTRPMASGRAGGRVTLQTPARLGQPPRLQTEDGWGARGHSEPVGHVPPSAQKGRGRSDVLEAGETATHPPGAAEAGRPYAGRRGRRRPSPPPPGEGQRGFAGSGAWDVRSPHRAARPHPQVPRLRGRGRPPPRGRGGDTC